MSGSVSYDVPIERLGDTLVQSSRSIQAKPWRSTPIHVMHSFAYERLCRSENVGLTHFLMKHLEWSGEISSFFAQQYPNPKNELQRAMGFIGAI